MLWLPLNTDAIALMTFGTRLTKTEEVLALRLLLGFIVISFNQMIKTS